MYNIDRKLNLNCISCISKLLTSITIYEKSAKLKKKTECTIKQNGVLHSATITIFLKCKLKTI